MLFHWKRGERERVLGGYHGNVLKYALSSGPTTSTTSEHPFTLPSLGPILLGEIPRGWISIRERERERKPLFFCTLLEDSEMP